MKDDVSLTPLGDKTSCEHTRWLLAPNRCHSRKLDSVDENLRGTKYDTTCYAEIKSKALAYIHNPYPNGIGLMGDKDGWWAAPYDYHEYDARTKDVVLDKGNAIALAVDIDAGDPDMEDVFRVTKGLLGDVEFLIYSSRSSGEQRTKQEQYPKYDAPKWVGVIGSTKSKWRVIIPFKHPIPASRYRFMQLSLTAAYHKYNLYCDKSMHTITQPMYLPNPGPVYLAVANEPGDYLDAANPEHPLVARANEEENEAAKEVVNQATGGRRTLGSSLISYRAAVAQYHPLENLMPKLGFETKDGTNFAFNGYTSPHNGKVFGGSSGSYSTKIFLDGNSKWVAKGDTVKSWATGGYNGDARWGDSYDLVEFLMFGGDKDAAISYAKQCQMFIIVPFVKHGRQILDNLYCNDLPVGETAIKNYVPKAVAELGSGPIDFPVMA